MSKSRKAAKGKDSETPEISPTVPRVRIPDQAKEKLSATLSEPKTEDVMKKLAEKNKMKREKQEAERDDTSDPPAVLPKEAFKTSSDMRRLKGKEKRDKEKETEKTGSGSGSVSFSDTQQFDNAISDIPETRIKSGSSGPTSPVVEREVIPTGKICPEKESFAENLSNPDTNTIMKKLAQKNKERMEKESEMATRLVFADSLEELNDGGVDIKFVSPLSPRSPRTSPPSTVTHTERICPEKESFGLCLSNPDTADVMKKLAQKNQERRMKEEFAHKLAISEVDEVDIKFVAPQRRNTVCTANPTREEFKLNFSDLGVNRTLVSTPSKESFGLNLSEPNTSDVMKKLAQKNKEKREMEQSRKSRSPGIERSSRGDSDTPPTRETPRRPSRPPVPISRDSDDDASPRSSSISPRVRSASFLPNSMSKPSLTAVSMPVATKTATQSLEDWSNSLSSPNTRDIMKKISEKNKTQSQATSHLLDQVIYHVEGELKSLTSLLQQLKDLKEQVPPNSPRTVDTLSPRGSPATTSTEEVPPIYTTTFITMSTSTSPSMSTATTTMPPTTASNEVVKPTLYQTQEEYQISLLLLQAIQHSSHTSSILLQAEVESIKNKLGRDKAKTQASNAAEVTTTLQSVLKQVTEGKRCEAPRVTPPDSTSNSIPIPRRQGSRPKSYRRRGVESTEDRFLDDILSRLAFRSRKNSMVKEREAKDLQPLEKDALRLSVKFAESDNFEEILSTLSVIEEQ